MAEADPNFRPDRARLVRRVPDSAIAAPLAILSAIIGLIILAWLILYITKGRFLRHPFERTVSSLLQRDVRVAGDFQLYFDPIDTKFVAEGLTISNPAWRGGEFFESKRIDTRIATLPLIFGTRRVKWLDLTNGKLDLAWDKAHKRNTFTFGDPDKKGKPFELPDIRTAQIVGTKISYLDPSLLLKTDISVETIRATDTRFAGDIRFTGNGTMRAIPFTLSGSLMSPNTTLAGGKNRLALAVRSGRTSLDVAGTLPGATVIEGADLKLLARGPNLSLLFDFLGVAIPDTRTFRVTSDLTKAGVDWKFTRLAGRFGDSDLGGTMTVSVPVGGRLNIAADLRTNTLDIIDAGPFIGYEPARLEAGKVAVPVAGIPRILPDAPLRIEAIKRFDAQVKYHVQNIRAKNVPISNIALNLDLNDSILKLSPLTFDMADGHLWSDISINARGAPVRTAYDIRLSPTPMGKLLARFGADQSGTTGTVKARIQMTGVGDSVRTSLASSNGRIAIIIPHGTFWTRNIQLAELDLGTYFQKLVMEKLKKPVEINCGLIAFTVRNGVAAADPILIDTTKNVIAGRGSFSFKDESLDLAFRGDGKKFSLFSAQSPIGVNGHFAKPGISVISEQLLGRAGVSVGLGLIASPLAAVLAFVDIGDAKSAQCGPILSGATANAQRTTKGQPRGDVGNGTASKQKKKFLGIF
ncbi:AsmA family protein [Sphingomonas paeninsulae]|uniref:AsmA family protein n=1 Tax=Sphingomonas paeninsulae TaxID=2319844 RepID=A0A494TGS7_SPHPE|nr:AsmA family protein [Sphingomonas paeninsulae]AYJ86644.1 AsmA family protein [Sphingomonas paeninsulae]